VNLPLITDDDRQFLSYNPNTDDIVVWVQQYALSARVELEQCLREIVSRSPAAWYGSHDREAMWEKARSIVDRPKNDTDFGHSTERPV
jgi:hypothetical protein